MTYDSPFSASGGVVIPEIASFIEEGLVIPEEWEEEKGIESRKLNPVVCAKSKSVSGIGNKSLPIILGP